MSFKFCLILLAIHCTCFGDVCLNMIVKDEADVIERCLSSVKDLIDYWVIVDTGSTDGTQKIIRTYMKDIPGELHERPWKNFAHNRNEALELAKPKADYILFIDADEVLVHESIRFDALTKDCYYIKTHYNGLCYDRVQLIKSSMPSEWRGTVHEVLYFNEPVSRETLYGIYNHVNTDGARSKDPKKYEKDVALLEQELKEKPNDTRTLFYLAQSYKDAEHPKEAVSAYRARVDAGGWDQEVFWSLLQIALLNESLNESDASVVKNYYDAFQYRSNRAEPLYYLAKFYRSRKDYAASYSLSKLGLLLSCPNDILFVEKWIYDYGLLLENSIAAYWLGKYSEAKRLSDQLMSMDLPANVKECVERNLRFIEAQL